MSFNTKMFRQNLVTALPAHAFITEKGTEVTYHWSVPANTWTILCDMPYGNVRSVKIHDNDHDVDVALCGDGLNFTMAVLRAVGAVSD